MNDLPHLTEIYDRLKRGYHLGPEDEPEFWLCASGLKITPRSSVTLG